MNEWKNYGDVNFIEHGGSLVKKEEGSRACKVFRLDTPSTTGLEDTWVARLYYVDIDEDMIVKLEEATGEQITDEISDEDIAVSLVDYGICDLYATFKSRYPGAIEDAYVNFVQLIDYMHLLDITEFTVKSFGFKKEEISLDEKDLIYLDKRDALVSGCYTDIKDIEKRFNEKLEYNQQIILKVFIHPLFNSISIGVYNVEDFDIWVLTDYFYLTGDDYKMFSDLFDEKAKKKNTSIKEIYRQKKYFEN